MKYYTYIIALLLSVLSASCERTIDFVDTSEAVKHNLTINAVASEGSRLGVYLNRTYSLNAVPILPYTYGYEQIFNYSVDWLAWRKNEFYKYTAVLDAHVEAVVNGSERYQLVLAEDTLGYWTDYKPQVGDHIKITATVGGDEAFAEATIPAKPQIEVVEHKIIQDSTITVDNQLRIDTIMHLKCRISDPGGEHFYRLRVRSEREIPFPLSAIYPDRGPVLVDTYILYRFHNGFSSEDLLFKRNNPYDEENNNSSFSDTFNNNLFVGHDYTFSIDVRKVYYRKEYATIWYEYQDNPYYLREFGIWGRDKIEDAYRLPPRVLLELQAITPDYYKYLKSVEFYNDSQEDKESSVGIYYNVQNGFGIFGALSYDRHFVEYGE